MKQLVAIAAFALVSGCESESTPSGSTDDVRTIEALQDRWADAYVALDTSAVGELLAEDYFVVTGETGGRVADRGRALQAILDHNPDWPIYAYELEDLDIRIYGITALVSGISDLKTRHRVSGAEGGLRSRFVHVWVKRENEWQLVSRQATPVNEPAPDET